MPLSGTGYAIRTGAFCATVFAAMGFYLPFFPLWLSERGFSATEIAVIVGTPSFLRPLFAPLLAALAERFPALGRAAVAYAIGAASGLAGLMVSSDFAAILVLATVSLVLWQTLIPLIDAILLAGVREHGIDYARVRLWGSVGFIAGSFAAGALLRLLPGDGVIGALIALSLAAAALGLMLPHVSQPVGAGRPAGLRMLASVPALRRAVLGGGLVIASHAAFYALGSLYWRRAGFSETTISALWAFGVAAEIGLLWSAKLLPRWGARRFLLLGAAGATVRWLLFPLIQTPTLAFGVQVLHAASFAATHLGVMMAIGAVATPGHTARIQGLHQFVSGSITGLAALSAGPLFKLSPPLAFWAMAALSIGGGLISAGLARGLQPQSPGPGGETRSAG